MRDALIDMGRADLIDDAVLGVSELVSNACLHARSTLTVAVIAGDEGVVRIEVRDESLVIPQPRQGGSLATTGRGLGILDALGKWGVTADGRGGKVVWFVPGDVDRHQPAAGRAGASRD